MMIRPLFALVAALTPAAAAAEAIAPCTPDQTYLSSPIPAIVPQDLIERTETIEIAAPLSEVIAITSSIDLQDTIGEGGDLPTVIDTVVLIGENFGEPGTRRLVCLSDDTTLLEQSLTRTVDENTYHFRYVVWNYTTPQAEAIEYGVGDFQFTALADNRTRIEWRYGFKLKSGVFPGNLGPVGAFLFRLGFLDRDYANMMRATLEGYRNAAEAES